MYTYLVGERGDLLFQLDITISRVLQSISKDLQYIHVSPPSLIVLRLLVGGDWGTRLSHPLSAILMGSNVHRKLDAVSFPGHGFKCAQKARCSLIPRPCPNTLL